MRVFWWVSDKWISCLIHCEPASFYQYFHLFTANIMKHPYKTQSKHDASKCKCLQLLSAISSKTVLTSVELFWLLPLSKGFLCRAFPCAEGPMRLHPEFSWLIVPFSVMLDDFNFKWSFPKLPAISNNHTLMKTWGEMNADTRSLPVWIVKVHTCQEKGLCAHM